MAKLVRSLICPFLKKMEVVKSNRFIQKHNYMGNIVKNEELGWCIFPETIVAKTFGQTSSNFFGKTLATPRDIFHSKFLINSNPIRMNYFV